MTPRAAASRCTKRCGKKAVAGGRCEDHQRVWETKSANTLTLSRGQRAKFRREQLDREPQCRVCGASEELEADHITEIADGGDPSDPSNAQTLCSLHHKEKTAHARRLRAAARRALDG